MAKKTAGELIKEARTDAGLTQEELAREVDGLSTSDISKAERGEKELTQAQLKAVAKATGVTQKSLLEAPGSSSKKTSPSSKNPRAASSKKLTAAEEKLVELYRKADPATRKAAVSVLKGEPAQAGKVISSILDSKAVKGALSGLLGKKK